MTEVLVMGETNPDLFFSQFFAAMIGATFGAALCLDDQEWQDLGLSLEEKELFACMEDQGITPDTLMDTMLDPDSGGVQAMEKLSASCFPVPLPNPVTSTNPGDRSSVTPEPDLPQETREAIVKLAQDTALDHLGLPEEERANLYLQSLEEATWHDSAMGCDQGQVIMPVVTHGYAAFMLHHAGAVMVHMDQSVRRAIVAENCGPLPPLEEKAKAIVTVYLGLTPAEKDQLTLISTEPAVWGQRRHGLPAGGLRLHPSGDPGIRGKTVPPRRNYNGPHEASRHRRLRSSKLLDRLLEEAENDRIRAS